MDLLDRLLEHDRWTTARLLALSRGPTDAQLDRAFDVGHRTEGDPQAWERATRRA